MADKFKGFQAGSGTVKIHAQLFSDVLPLIDDLGELKVILFCYRALMQKQGKFRSLRRDDFAQDEVLMRSLGDGDPQALLDAALSKAVADGVLLCVELAHHNHSEAYYFMNTARGRKAVEQVEQGNWTPAEDNTINILPERPGIYSLYEENIGVLTPRIADHLRSAEDDYPYRWIIDAIHAAVDNNVRHWNYISAILERWKQEGRHDEKSRRSDERDERDFTGGEYADFIES